jgi:hypothetical protein
MILDDRKFLWDPMVIVSETDTISCGYISKKKGVFYYILNARLLICCLLNYKAEAKMHSPEPGHQMVLSAGLSLPLPLRRNRT